MVKHLKWWNVQTLTNLQGTPCPMSILAEGPDEAIAKALRNIEVDSTIQCTFNGKIVTLPIYFVSGVWPDNAKEQGVWQRRLKHLKQRSRELAREIIN